MPKKRNSISDIRGAGLLTKEGINLIIDIVEAIHYNITSFGGLLGKNKKQRTSGITGMVYNNIRAITDLSGEGFDALMDRLTLVINDKKPSPDHEALVSVVNGVLGDHLEESKNPLAIPMQLRQHGKPLIGTDQVPPGAMKKIVLLVHGSCLNDLKWNRQGHDHGASIARDFGYTPVYLLYNSGRHISHNGKELAKLLEYFFSKTPNDIELIILAHSMGGLVCRSAYYYAEKSNHRWQNHLRNLIFLGTPHHGAPLEQGGNIIDNILEKSPYSAPISRLGKIRSAGITDLRYGNIIDEDWNKYDRFAPAGDQRTPLPLPPKVKCATIAATISESPDKLGDDLIGDGLVPLKSALGEHENPMKNLSFSHENKWIGRNMRHLDLLSHPDVYAAIKNWLQSENAALNQDDNSRK